jgi:hypothetical protein
MIEVRCSVCECTCVCASVYKHPSCNIGILTHTLSHSPTHPQIDTCPKCKHGVCTAPYTMCACDGNYGNIFKRDCSECNPSHMDYASGCQTLSPYGACVTGNECQGWPCHCNNAGVCEIPAGYSTDFDGCCVGVNGGGGNQNQLQNHINNAQTPNRHHQHYQHYTDAVVHSCWPGDPIDPFYSGDGPIDPY